MELEYERLAKKHAPFIYSMMSSDEYDCIFCEKNTSIKTWKKTIKATLKDRGEDNYIAYDVFTHEPVGWVGYEISNRICKLHIIVIHP